MWRSSLMFAGYIVGWRVHRPWRRHSCWMHWSRRYGPADRPARSITVIKVLSMYRWLTHSGLRKPDYWHQQEVQATCMTTRWREHQWSLQSGGNTPVRAGKPCRSGTGPHSRGWTGITIDDCWEGWAIPPAEAEKAYYASIGNNDLAAWSSQIKHFQETRGGSRLQRQLSRKVKFSNNWQKQKRKIQRPHSWVSHISAGLPSQSHNDRHKNHAMIVIEDLKVSNMSKSAAGTVTPGRNVRAKSGLNRSILDQGWYEMRRQLEYKQL